MGSKEVGLLLTVVMLVLAFDCGTCNTQDIGVVVSFRSNAVIRVEDSESVLHRDSKSVHRSRRSVLNSREIQQVLDDHNRLRRLVGASDMELMTWNSYLASMADDWAKACQWKLGQPERDQNTLPYKNLGQSLYYISGAPFNITAAVQEWYKDRQYFSNETLECQPERNCFVYTQIVWASSRELGCAYVHCSTLYIANWPNAAFLVCNYGPAGNLKGQKPYQIGTACSRCATGSRWCNKGLCDRNCTTIGPTCACNPTCQNYGSVNSDNCTCACAPGWWGSDCSVECKDNDSNCDPQLRSAAGWPPSYCTDREYGPTVREKCPKMCKLCQGRYSSGSLTRKPINTADIAGSSNITLECASSYGTDATRWSFAPLGPSSNKTIWISNGYQLLLTTNDQQKYVLRATVDSSVLVVLQLSSLTEGNYSCYDGVESTSALLLVIPFPISMEPLFGPIAGGTNIAIIGSSTIEYLSTYFRPYLPEIRGVRNVYIGNDFPAASVTLLPNASSTFDVVAVTSSRTKTAIGHHLPIIIEFSPTPFNLTFNRAFTYLPNPEITSIYPNNFIVTGGTLLDVFGQGLSSVAKPVIQLTVIITREAENSSTSTTSSTSTSRVCTVLPWNDTYMQCPIPPLSLPDDFLAILNSQYNSNPSRKRRNMRPSYPFSRNSHGRLSRTKRDSNSVLTVHGPNGTGQADIYLAIFFDGYKEYENFSSALPDIKFNIYSNPEINSSNQLLQFDPSKDELIYVKGRHMLRGCLLRDYLVHIGNQICSNSGLQDNQLSCRPPKEKPSSTVNDTIYCDQHLSITITLGYKRYQYACLTYPDTRKVALIIGLTVGLGGFAIFLTILIVWIVVCRRRKVSKVTDRPQDTGGQELRNRHNDNAVQPESHKDYGHQREPSDGYLKPNDDYLTSDA